MTPDRNDPDATPPQPDGELQAYLRDHPDGAAEVEALRRLSRLFQEHAAPEPTPAAWDAALQKIESGLDAPRPAPRPKRRFPAFRVGAGVAAACLAGLLLAHTFMSAPAKITAPSVASDDEPYPVATAGEIVILSMNPANSSSLVVGKTPVHDDLVLAGPDDVSLVDAKPNGDGQMPEIRFGGNMPVIVPTSNWGDKDKDKDEEN